MEEQYYYINAQKIDLFKKGLDEFFGGLLLSPNQIQVTEILDKYADFTLALIKEAKCTL